MKLPILKGSPYARCCEGATCQATSATSARQQFEGLGYWVILLLFLLHSNVPVFAQQQQATLPKTTLSNATPNHQPAQPQRSESTQESNSPDTPADGLIWHDVTDWGVEGRILPNQERENWFDRLPASAKGHVTNNVWGLSRDSAGMMVRFRSNSSTLHVDYQLTDKNLAMPHMPATGVSGVDLYARDELGRWRWVQCSRPREAHVKAELISGLAEGTREYAMYLPLYNGVSSLRIGVEEDSAFEGLAPRDKPIVFYGTSITHGACASRPGMVHTAILGRALDLPVVNLGFSGNGRMHKEVADYLIQIDARAFVIDCLPNMRPAQVTERCEPLVRQLREAHPETPIVLVEDRRFTNSWITPAKQAFHSENHAALKAAYEQLLESGVQGLYYIEGDLLYGYDSEGATDGSHANDLGFMRQARIFEPILRAALSSH